MARPRKNPAQGATQIEAEIAEEGTQYALLQRDLREALVAGENTRPYRQAIAQIVGKIEHLQVKLGAMRQAEEEQRHALIATTADEIAAEAMRRHSDMLERLDAPAFPRIERTKNVTF